MLDHKGLFELNGSRQKARPKSQIKYCKTKGKFKGWDSRVRLGKQKSFLGK